MPAVSVRGSGQPSAGRHRGTPERPPGGPPQARALTSGKGRPGKRSAGMPGIDGVEITGPAGDRYDEILTPGALALIARLQRELGQRRAGLLAARASRQQDLIMGGTLDFLAETRHIRDDKSWRVAPPAPGLVDRRVEITGPTDRKMTINALNSGAKVWLADFEDANTPLWQNMIEGQLNLRDALRREIDFTSQEGKSYPPAFEMDEILYELREHSAGLNAGRWDYIFSVIKKFRTRGRDFLLPDRAQVTMTVPFIRAYTELLVRTCHQHGAHAIGGMAAFIPSRKDAAV